MLILQISALAILAGMIAPLRGQGTVTQTSGPGTMTQRTSDSATSGNRKAVRHRQSARKVIPIETAPPDAPVPASSQQKAADQTLLHQQQAQSDRAAQITNVQVQKAQQQQEKVQGEVRIQDAPGPVQTGVLSGGAVASPNPDQRIQDAPGPAQTLPPVGYVAPSQLPSPPTTPPASTPPGV
jgi:hypothetical protein